jgi:hypothetical protein
MPFVLLIFVEKIFYMYKVGPAGSTKAIGATSRSLMPCFILQTILNKSVRSVTFVYFQLHPLFGNIAFLIVLVYIV